MKKFLINCAVITGIFPTIFLASCSNNKKSELVTNPIPVDVQMPISSLKTRLIESISNLKVHDKDVASDLPNTPSSMVDRVSSANETALINESRDSQDKEIIILKDQLRKELVTYQRITFPKIRKHYQEFLKSLYWEVDIDVQLGGTRNTILTFIGGTFAANINKKNMMESINQQVKAMRFKRVNFKWIPDDDNYTYYKVESPDDQVIE